MGRPDTTLHTEVAVVGSGAGGAVTAARLAAAGRDVTVLEEGPRSEPDAVAPFSLEEMATKYRHRGLSASLGSPAIAFAEGRCVGGSTEINSGLYHRLPGELAAEWARAYAIDGFDPGTLDRYAAEVEAELGVSRLPGPAPRSSAVLEEGATKLGWRAVEFARVHRYEPGGRAVKQTMSRTLLPRAEADGATVLADCRVLRVRRRAGRAVGLDVERTRPDGTRQRVAVLADHVVVCAGAIQTPTLLQRSGVRGVVGTGLKVHPTIKVAARFGEPMEHDDVPMHRVTEFSPHLTIGGSASRRGHLALALAETGLDATEAMADWEHVAVYYAAIRSEGRGRITALPGAAAPLVTYGLTDGDLSRLARGLVHVGDVLLAAGAFELHPSIVGGPVVRDRAGLVQWWDAVTRRRANLMTVHMTSTVRMGEDPDRTGTDSYGRVHGHANLYVNDASLLPDAPGVNPQGAVMAIASRNAEHLLATL
ncbi:MAG TPA: GMC family oxidoreductase [Acidimicrobiales bacterium]|nr:GMC family oxidoreductase [Acidimicrobiales bacterium]